MPQHLLMESRAEREDRSWQRNRLPGHSEVSPRACERLSSSIFQDGSETRGAQRPDGGGGERIRKGLSGCWGKQGGRELWQRGTGKPFLGQREWARQTEAGEKLKSKDGSTGEVAGEVRKEVGRLSRREDQLPILRVPQVDFDSRSSPVWMVKSCPGFHPTKTLQSPFAASLLNWNSWPSWLGLREAAPLLSRASKLLPRLSLLPLLSAPTFLNLNFSLRNDPIFRHATSSCVPGRANWRPPLKERKQRPHAG